MLEFLAGHKIEVFTATWCPDCRRLDRFLAESRVPHSQVDIDSVAGAADELESQTGKRGVPYLRIDGTRWVRGYHKELPTRFDPKLFVVELEAAIADLPKH
ncbi:MAG: glutaredoxin family protein [Planctomycetes bacterium]|nr:glutaredoxin family protein [Planctomycetota bacterium]